MTTSTEYQFIEAKDLKEGDMTEHGFITRLFVTWDGVLITTEGMNLKTGNTYETRWCEAPTHFVKVMR